jgi:V/A-type H+-transporting ATPase subunit E
MNGIEKITAKIAADAEADVKKLQAETEQKIDALRAQTAAQAAQEKQAILARGEKAAAERLERLESAAQMEQRKLALAAKQEVVGEAFEMAVEKLCNLPDKELIALLTELAVEASTTGREALIFSVKDRARIGKQVVIAANELLVKKAAPGLPDSYADNKVGAFLGKVVNTTAAVVTGTGQMTLSEQTRPMRGGFIMADDNVEVNCTFETLVRLQREQLERDVANVLFK